MRFSTNARIAKRCLERSQVIAACIAHLALWHALLFKGMTVAPVVAVAR